MKIIKEFLFDIIGIILFCSAMTLLFIIQKQDFQGYRKLKDVVMESDILYEKSEIASSDFSFLEKNEVISDLITGISYDIKINDIYYKETEFNPSLFDFSSLKSTYVKNYVIDVKTGDIQYISYE